jgi:hypothetical protein
VCVCVCVKDAKLELSQFTIRLYVFIACTKNKETKQNLPTTTNHSQHKHHYTQYNIQQYHERRFNSAHTT